MSETGRFRVKSEKTGIVYVVEPLTVGQKSDWGDVNPATKQVEGAYGLKHRGAVRPDESIITTENGFKNINVLPPGVSPIGQIEEVDKTRYEQGFRPKPLDKAPQVV